jgi:hypothetical protein
MVTMSQKSSVPQAAKSVSQVLIPDTIFSDRRRSTRCPRHWARILRGTAGSEKLCLRRIGLVIVGEIRGKRSAATVTGSSSLSHLLFFFFAM